jgi:hypothetical protein
LFCGFFHGGHEKQKLFSAEFNGVCFTCNFVPFFVAFPFCFLDFSWILCNKLEKDTYRPALPFGGVPGSSATGSPGC